MSGPVARVAFDEFRKAPAKYMATEGPLYIESKERSVVMLSAEKYEGLVETIHLLSNPANAKELLSAIADADAGKFIERELIDE